jgi:hypothetical protein
MIGQHPNLAGLPELKLFCCENIRELEASLPRYWIERGVTHRSPGLVRALAQFEFGDQGLRSLSAARAWLQDRQDWLGGDVMDVLLRRLTPRIAVEKSPDNILDDEALRRMDAAYPRARYLHLTRHPITTQRSMEEYRRRTAPSLGIDGEPMSGIGAWYDIHRRILHFAAQLPACRYLRVRAEDVLNEPERQLYKIVVWLGVSTDDQAIEAMLHPEESPFARAAPAESGVAGGNDPNFLRDPIPRRVAGCCKLQPPEGWLADLSAWNLVANLANRLGYFDAASAPGFDPASYG